MGTPCFPHRVPLPLPCIHQGPGQPVLGLMPKFILGAGAQGVNTRSPVLWGLRGFQQELHAESGAEALVLFVSVFVPLEKFTRVLVEQQQDRARRERERIRLFSADPFDLEAQAKIEEDIR